MDQKPLVLVVDNEFSHLTLMESMLAEAGCEAVSADHPKDALEMLRTQTPDLIVMNVDLPGISGIDICSRLKGVKRLRGVPVILVGSDLTDATRELARWEGVATILEKPLSPAAFHGSISKTLALPPRLEPAPA